MKNKFLKNKSSTFIYNKRQFVKRNSQKETKN